jgi:hypothetical protein
LERLFPVCKECCNKKKAYRSSWNEGTASAVRQPKIVAEMPQDEELESPEEAAENDGFPGSCQL